MKKNKFLTAITDYFTNMDKMLWLIMLFIISFSLVLLKSVSRATYSDYFSTQFVAIVVGLIGAVVITVIGYVSISNYWYLIAAASRFSSAAAPIWQRSCKLLTKLAASVSSTLPS